MKTGGLGSGESRLETIISYILITGVVISLLVLAAGITGFFITSGIAVSHDQSIYVRGHDFFSFIVDQFRGKNAGGTPVVLISVGIIALILTPYLRVVASLIYFAVQKNTKYVVITLFVLVVVTLSLALH